MLGIHDEMDIALGVQGDVLRAMAGHGGQPHAVEELS